MNLTVIRFVFICILNAVTFLIFVFPPVFYTIPQCRPVVDCLSVAESASLFARTIFIKRRQYLIFFFSFLATKIEIIFSIKF